MKVENITRHNGVAGQISYTVDVTYPDEATDRYEFVGSVYGFPVVAISPTGHQVFVRDPGRFGSELNPEWVRRFFNGGHST